MQFIHASLAALLLQAVGAAPNPFPLPTPAPTLQIRQQSNTTTSAPTATLTGEFTGVDGGLYEVTSESGYVIVAGHTLSAGGADALVGNGDVTVASGGFLANGQAITFLSITSTSSTAVSTTSASTAASTSSGAASGSQSGTAAAASSSSSSSQAGAAATGVPLAGAVLGGLMGLVLL
ncbi:hypothetical protein M409DRAFT_54808 [Zasmidium cellare ATCC 36951]|uniref:Uncharacterized protein n=1 Tax=Zasmidium cellare ATCC 36951 TaxID=1080233 RepID=A0A6A6CKK7_ZASCE|nr:uncharacterized protein M409DRAFT_54808 [Zasmidium cellare ATCC 36951]KAF2166462.1 hypothetical protein M409DRAFT_54808 [Zasmidium cellare ATCC 36951]